MRYAFHKEKIIYEEYSNWIYSLIKALVFKEIESNFLTIRQSNTTSIQNELSEKDFLSPNMLSKIDGKINDITDSDDLKNEQYILLPFLEFEDRKYYKYKFYEKILLRLYDFCRRINM